MRPGPNPTRRRATTAGRKYLSIRAGKDSLEEAELFSRPIDFKYGTDSLCDTTGTSWDRWSPASLSRVPDLWGGMPYRSANCPRASGCQIQACGFQVPRLYGSVTNSAITRPICLAWSGVVQAGGMAYSTLPRGRRSTPRSMLAARRLADILAM